MFSVSLHLSGAAAMLWVILFKSSFNVIGGELFKVSLLLFDVSYLFVVQGELFVNLDQLHVCFSEVTCY